MEAVSGATSRVPDTTLPPLLETEPLRRDVTRLGLALISLNGVVGAGIFGLPAGAARLTGLFSPVLFLFCGLLIAIIMLSNAQASSYFQGTGGHMLYARAAFGPMAGFQTGWLMYVGRLTAVAANSNLFATYLAIYIPAAGEGLGRAFVITAMAVLFAWLNISGVRQGVRAIIAISVAKFIPLVLFTLIGLSYVRPSMFAGAVAPSIGTVGEAALLVFYAFVGFEGSLVLAGESKNPKRDMPKAMLITALVGTLLYTGIQIVSVALTPNLAESTRPLADAAEIFMGPVGVAMLAFAAMASILGNYGAIMVSAPRLTYALARDGSLPDWLGSVHSRYLTPHVSILVFLVIGVSLGVAGTFTKLAIMSSLARLIAYAIGLLALPRLRKQFGDQPDAMQLPGGLLIPGAGLVICVWLMAQVQWTAVWQTGALIALGTVLYVSARYTARFSGRTS